MPTVDQNRHIGSSHHLKSHDVMNDSGAKFQWNSCLHVSSSKAIAAISLHLSLTAYLLLGPKSYQRPAVKRSQAPKSVWACFHTYHSNRPVRNNISWWKPNSSTAVQSIVLLTAFFRRQHSGPHNELTETGLVLIWECYEMLQTMLTCFRCRTRVDRSIELQSWKIIEFLSSSKLICSKTKNMKLSLINTGALMHLGGLNVKSASAKIPSPFGQNTLPMYLWDFMLMFAFSDTLQSLIVSVRNHMPINKKYTKLYSPCCICAAHVQGNSKCAYNSIFAFLG